MPATDSPAVVPPNHDKIFKGYSFIAPQIYHSMHKLKSPSLQHNDKPPAPSPFFEAYDVDLSEKILGEGSFSVCRRCVEKSSGREFAVKIVGKSTDCTQEINLLRACQGHPNVVRLHEVMHDESYTYLICELLKGGELLDRIRRKSR